jgi:hypothetical protein
MCWFLVKGDARMDPPWNRKKAFVVVAWKGQVQEKSPGDTQAHPEVESVEGGHYSKHWRRRAERSETMAGSYSRPEKAGVGSEEIHIRTTARLRVPRGWRACKLASVLVEGQSSALQGLDRRTQNQGCLELQEPPIYSQK